MTAGNQVDKARVYEVAREVQKQMGWCEDGFERAMRKLDIDPKKFSEHDALVQRVRDLKECEALRAVGLVVMVIKTRGDFLVTPAYENPVQFKDNSEGPRLVVEYLRKRWPDLTFGDTAKIL